MRTTSLVLAAGLAASTFATACTADDVTDELSGEGDDGEAGKDDSTGAFTYFQLQLEPNVAPDVAGFIVTRPNRTTIACGSTSSAPTCFVRSVDWSKTHLPEEYGEELEERLRGGEQLLLRGATAAETPTTRAHRLGTLATVALANAAQIAPHTVATVGADNGPDCLYATLDVTGFTAGNATLSVDADLHVTIGLDNVAIAGTSKFAVSCVDGTTPVTIKLAHVDLTGTLGADSLQASGASGVVVEAPGMPSPVMDMMPLFDRAPAIAGSTVAVVLKPLATETGTALQLTASEVWVPSTGSAPAASDDTFVIATKTASRIKERRVNSTRTATIDLIDFAASGAPADEIDTANDTLDGGDDVIVSGPRYSKSGKLGRRAIQFWTRMVE